MTKIYVEGGNSRSKESRNKYLDITARLAFKALFEKAGIGKKPTVVMKGPRNDAYDAFCNALGREEKVYLLVDSEIAVASNFQISQSSRGDPWGHLAQPSAGGFIRPINATDLECHLMVECMENWLLADIGNLKDYFKNGFNDRGIKNCTNAVEKVSKSDAQKKLKDATQRCNRNKKFKKGIQSFEILKGVGAAKLIVASPWFKRLIDELK